MTERLNEIFKNIPACRTFADVGCDHGYIARAVLDEGRAERAVVSDISKKCLDKACALLSDYISAGRCSAVVSDGFRALPPADCALIAGMGGEEIIKILKEAPYLPRKLVLQPMKNSDKLRVYAVKAGYRILKDYTFFAGGGYYDVVVCERGEDVLTEEEAEFGRTNIKERPSAFRAFMRLAAKKQREIARGQRLSEERRREFIARAERFERYAEEPADQLKDGRENDA